MKIGFGSRDEIAKPALSLNDRLSDHASSGETHLPDHEYHGYSPLVQRFLDMSKDKHQRLLDHLKGSSEPIDEEEYQAAMEAMDIRKTSSS